MILLDIQVSHLLRTFILWYQDRYVIYVMNYVHCMVIDILHIRFSFREKKWLQFLLKHLFALESFSSFFLFHLTWLLHSPVYASILVIIILNCANSCGLNIEFNNRWERIICAIALWSKHGITKTLAVPVAYLLHRIRMWHGKPY